MTFKRWDDLLIAEHELIERAMAVLKTCLDDLDRALAAPVQLRRALEFLLEFGDKVHNHKEETFLFPRMAERGIPMEGGPLAVMLHEHQQERELLAAMAAQAAAGTAMSAEERRAFVQRGTEYLQVRAEHIWKENDVLYPMARQVFSEADTSDMLAAFVEFDRTTYGDDAHERYRAMVAEAEAGDRARRGLIHNLSYEQIEAIMETLPFEVTFVDAQDTVAYFNRLDKEKLFPRTRSVIGRKVTRCHPEKSVAMVEAIVKGFRDRTRDKAEFWIDFRGDKVLIRYFPVYNDAGEYMGVLEVTQAIGAIQKLTGEKRLLD